MFLAFGHDAVYDVPYIKGRRSADGDVPGGGANPGILAVLVAQGWVVGSIHLAYVAGPQALGGYDAADEEAFARNEADAFAFMVDASGSMMQTIGKRSPVDGLSAFYAANPGSCVHIISAAYTPQEKAGVEALAAVNSCTQVADLEALASSEEMLKGFVEDTLYKDCSQVGLIEIQDVYFDFDKSVVTAESAERLNKAIEILKNRPNEKVTIVGWTDWTGSDAYNAGLSERRAQAVKDYFVKQGLDASQLEIIGKGKSFKYSNATSEGRHMNRRVELVFVKQP